MTCWVKKMPSRSGLQRALFGKSHDLRRRFIGEMLTGVLEDVPNLRSANGIDQRIAVFVSDVTRAEGDDDGREIAGQSPIAALHRRLDEDIRAATRSRTVSWSMIPTAISPLVVGGLDCGNIGCEAGRQRPGSSGSRRAPPRRNRPCAARLWEIVDRAGKSERNPARTGGGRLPKQARRHRESARAESPGSHRLSSSCRPSQLGMSNSRCIVTRTVFATPGPFRRSPGDFDTVRRNPGHTR